MSTSSYLSRFWSERVNRTDVKSVVARNPGGGRHLHRASLPQDNQGSPTHQAMMAERRQVTTRGALQAQPGPPGRRGPQPAPSCSRRAASSLEGRRASSCGNAPRSVPRCAHGRHAGGRRWCSNVASCGCGTARSRTRRIEIRRRHEARLEARLPPFAALAATLESAAKLARPLSTGPPQIADCSAAARTGARSMSLRIVACA